MKRKNPKPPIEAICAVYIWQDGALPTERLRSKTLIVRRLESMKPVTLIDMPLWGFDGSSTNQATTKDSDCVLMPVNLIPDPIRGGKNVLVLCEVMNSDGTPHKTNARALLREAVLKYKKQRPLFGLEQEYTLYEERGRIPYGWPKNGKNLPKQGRYYCGVGCDEVYGAHLIEEHTQALLRAGIGLHGTNAEVFPGQWEFQIGPLPPLEVADQVLFARWILYELGGKHGISIKLDPKPRNGNWNGAGMHANFSTKAMMAKGGMEVIYKVLEKFSVVHKEHIAVYGADNDKRLTGKHETAKINVFRAGASDRGASIRIPLSTVKNKKGYIEDRRPAANANPYKVVYAILETVCGNGFERPKHWPIDVKI